MQLTTFLGPSRTTCEGEDDDDPDGFFMKSKNELSFPYQNTTFKFKIEKTYHLLRVVKTHSFF